MKRQQSQMMTPIRHLQIRDKRHLGWFINPAAAQLMMRERESVCVYVVKLGGACGEFTQKPISGETSLESLVSAQSCMMTLGDIYLIHG